MSASFPHFSWWVWREKEKEPVFCDGSSMSSSSDWVSGSRELDTVKFPLGKGAKKASPGGRVKRKWHSREQRRIDREFDVVLVPSDGVCLSASGSESDESDWSIGWLEPHASDFQSDGEAADSFAVLVPCYRRGCKELELPPQMQWFNAFKNLPKQYPDEGNKYVEQWLSTLQNS